MVEVKAVGTGRLVRLCTAGGYCEDITDKEDGEGRNRGWKSCDGH